MTLSRISGQNRWCAGHSFPAAAVRDNDGARKAGGAWADQLYPLALRLTGRRVLVVGGGAVATRRVPALVDAGAEVILVSPALTPALRAMADAGRLRWRRRRFQESDLDGVWLVQVAVDDPAAAETVSAAAERRQIFCVRADDRRAASRLDPGGDPARSGHRRRARRRRPTPGGARSAPIRDRPRRRDDPGRCPGRGVGRRGRDRMGRAGRRRPRRPGADHRAGAASAG